LSVPISAPAPGFDAIHKLTDPEKKEYLTKGITGPNKRHGNEFYQVCFEFLEVIFRLYNFSFSSEIPVVFHFQ
jgi:hypothetical protein